MFRGNHRSPAVLVYLTMSGVATFANSLVLTVLAIYYITVVGMNPLQLVLAGTVFEIAILLFEVPTGAIADTFSRRLSVIVGMCILGAALVLEGLVPLFAAVIVAEAIGGVGETFLSGATDAWLAGEAGEEQVGRIYLRAAQLKRAAGILGVLVSVSLASFQLNLPVVLGGALYLALGVFLALCMPERNFRPAAPEERASWRAAIGTFRTGIRAVRASPLLLALLGVNLFAGAAGEGIDRLWEAHLLLDFTLPALGALKPVVWFGIINVGAAIVSMIVAAVFRRQMEAIGRSPAGTARALMLFNMFLVSSVIVFGLSGSFALAFAALLLRAVLNTLAAPLYQTWLVQQTTPQARATVLSIGSQANAFGETAGGPVVGAIGTGASLRVALVVSGVLLAPVVALFAHTLRRGTADAGAMVEPETRAGTPESAA
jgi:MFS transporter, DHA3 family, tetracycline resistance protein